MTSSFKVAAVQAAPVFMNLNETVDKAVELIDEAGEQGVRIIVFPETWIPGYPWWIWLDAPAMNMQYVAPYAMNSIEAGSTQDKALAAAAKRNNIQVIMGVSAKVGGSLYMGQWHYGANGDIISRRRKLKPTHVERAVFGEGDGSDMIVVDTELGRVGALCCWEHLQPLNKYAMYSQNEQIHAAAWPSFSLYLGAAYALGPELNTAASMMYAAEGQCFVIAACATVSKEMIDFLCDSPAKQQFLQEGGGHANIFGPDGAPLCDTLDPKEEGLLTAEINLDAIAVAKSAADPVGHYSRTDVFRLMFNNKPAPAVMSFDDARSMLTDETTDQTSEQIASISPD